MIYYKKVLEIVVLGLETDGQLFIICVHIYVDK